MDAVDEERVVLKSAAVLERHDGDRRAGVSCGRGSAGPASRRVWRVVGALAVVPPEQAAAEQQSSVSIASSVPLTRC